MYMYSLLCILQYSRYFMYSGSITSCTRKASSVNRVYDREWQCKLTYESLFYHYCKKYSCKHRQL